MWPLEGSNKFIVLDEEESTAPVDSEMTVAELFNKHTGDEQRYSDMEEEYY